jgi:hypothetical protein
MELLWMDPKLYGNYCTSWPWDGVAVRVDEKEMLGHRFEHLHFLGRGFSCARLRASWSPAGISESDVGHTAGRSPLS